MFGIYVAECERRQFNIEGDQPKSSKTKHLVSSSIACR